MEADNTNKKLGTVSFVLAAFLAHQIVRVVFETLGTSFAVVERFRSIEVVRHGLPLLAGFGLFLFLQFNSRILAWSDEVLLEIRKIVWPSQRDTVSMTIVVCIMVVFAGLSLSVIDWISSEIIKVLVK